MLYSFYILCGYPSFQWGKCWIQLPCTWLLCTITNYEIMTCSSGWQRKRCTKWIGKPDKITKIVTVNENYIHLIMIHLFTESIYIFWVDAEKNEQENNCNLVRALEIRDANFWQYHTCCSMTTRAIAAWTTFVRSKQSIQFTLKIPSCLQISPAWSTLCWHKKTKIPLCYHHSHNSLA